MYPVLVIRRRVSRSFNFAPCLRQILHHVTVGFVFQNFCIPSLVQNPAGRCRSNEIDELGANDREIILYIGVVEAFIVFVPVEDQFKQPSIAIASIRGKWLHIFIGLKDDSAKGIFLLRYLSVSKAFLMERSTKQCSSRDAVEIFRKAYNQVPFFMIRLLYRDIFARTFQSPIKTEGVIVCNPLIIPFDGRQVVKTWSVREVSADCFYWETPCRQ